VDDLKPVMKMMQIMPAEGWWAIFEETTPEGKVEEVKTPVVCFALYDNNAIEPIIWDNGCMRSAHGVDGFVDIDREDPDESETPCQPLGQI